MTEQAKSFSIAISLTILDSAVAMYYGGAVWRAWSEMLPARILLVLFGALWATTLMHLWACAFYDWSHELRACGQCLSPTIAALTVELREDGDV